MKYTVLTLFPEVIAPYLESSILGRAAALGHISYELCQIRDFAVNEYGKVDDQLYGGGAGMLMMAEPIWQAWSYVQGLDPDKATAKDSKDDVQTIYLSPRGQVLDQELALKLSSFSQLILICGHYEGIDERVVERTNALEISLGDFVLSGGEIAALALIDTVSRLIPGVFSSEEVWQEESHATGLLAEAQYTRPALWREMPVPEVLLSGHEAKIKSWRKLSALNSTLERRADLLEKINLEQEAWEELLKFRQKLAEK